VDQDHVANRPDPSADPIVRGLSDAQADASRRLGSAPGRSPRSGIEWLNRAFFPGPALLGVVPPRVRIGHTQTFHLLGSQLKQCGVESITRELVKQHPNGDPASAGCFSKAIPYLKGP